MSSRITGPRRGAVAVIVAVLLVVLLGCTAFAIDFSRRFASKAELQTSADAAAMAGAIELVLGRPATGEAAAIEYGQKNLVETVLPTIASADVEPGSWDDAANAFVKSTWVDPSINAVRVTARHTVNYAFAPVIGISSSAISATAIGALGSVNSSSCVKPWAMPYSNLLQALGKDPAGLDYELTDADIAQLRAQTIEDNIMFKVGPPNEKDSEAFKVPGSFYAVQFPPIVYEDGTKGGPDHGLPPYVESILNCSSTPISVGDWLQAKQGNMANPTTTAVETYCNNHDGFGGSKGPCNVIMPIFADYATGGVPIFKVKYLAGFVITGVQKPGKVFGYLDSFNYSGGSWTPGGVGPITRAVLVR